MTEKFFPSSIVIFNNQTEASFHRIQIVRWKFKINNSRSNIQRNLYRLLNSTNIYLKGNFQNFILTVWKLKIV